MSFIKKVSLVVLTLFLSNNAFASNWYVYDYSDLTGEDGAMASYADGDVVYIMNNIADATALLSQSGNGSLVIDGQGFDYVASEPTFQLLNANDLYIKNFGSELAPISGFYSNTGAIYSTNNLTILNSYFSENGYYGDSYALNGGVIYFAGNDKKLNIINSNFTNNSVGSLSSSVSTNTRGGVLFISKGDVNILGSNFTNNSVYAKSRTAYGGVIRVETSSNSVNLKIKNSSFVDNKAEGNNAYGGAITTSGSGITILMEDSLFSENKANGNDTMNGGGGVISISDSATIINSTFTNNSTNYGGGGAIRYNGNALNIIANMGMFYLTVIPVLMEFIMIFILQK